jgi:hypothetical protein
VAFNFNVAMQDKSLYRITKLLGGGASNTKTFKSDKANLGYITYSLSLAPASVSGFNVCSSSSHACRLSCLYTSGLANIFPRTIQPSRIAKTRMLRMHKKEFISQLIKELGSAERRASRLGVKLCVRLNVLSDIFWEREAPEIFTTFPKVVFYDYSKHEKRFARYLKGELPSNYHLTFSWSGTNREMSLYVLANGGNVAVPFRVSYRGDNRKPLPRFFLDHEVIDGDIIDARFLDKQGGYVVGLRAKGKAKHDTSGFVINTYDTEVTV